MIRSDLPVPNNIDPLLAHYISNLQDRVRALEAQEASLVKDLEILKSKVQALES